jgi:hypothetical protein
MNAAFGGVSAGRVGSPLSEVTQSGDGPCAFVASHPTANAGGVGSSKFSPKVRREKQAGHWLLRISAAVGWIAIIAMPAAMSKRKQRIPLSRVGANVCLGFLIIATATNSS